MASESDAVEAEPCAKGSERLRWAIADAGQQGRIRDEAAVDSRFDGTRAWAGGRMEIGEAELDTEPETETGTEKRETEAETETYEDGEGSDTRPLLPAHSAMRPSPGSRPYASSPAPSTAVPGVALEDLLHGLHSFGAIVLPVALAMVLSALASLLASSARVAEGMRAYLVHKDIEGGDGGTQSKLVQALENAAAIVAFIAAITFIIVLCYKLRCACFLQGYLVFASSMLLGYMGSVLAEAMVVDGMGWPVDWPSAILVMFNFAAVGAVAIFYQKGVPRALTQAYLVATAVVLAWQLAQLPDWSAWSILFLLAFYDLCAVLSPCGPLRCLLNLMQKQQTPLPGLLYEAEVRTSSIPAARMQRGRETASVAVPVGEPLIGHEEQDFHLPVLVEGLEGTKTARTSSSEARRTHTNFDRAAVSCTADLGGAVESGSDGILVSDSLVSVDQAYDNWASARGAKEPKTDFAGAAAEDLDRNSPGAAVASGDTQTQPTGPRGATEQEMRGLQRQLEAFYRRFAPDRVGRAAEVARRFAGREQELWPLLYRKYRVRETLGQQLEDDEEQSIKLGLGDFVFYSVLVSKAAMQSFGAFAICMEAIMLGLALTLALLAVLKMALPALPFSILMGIVFFLAAQQAILPFLDVLVSHGIFF